MSHHHILPPIAQAADPRKPNQAQRRRRAASTPDSSAAEEIDAALETRGGAPSAPVRAIPLQRAAAPAAGEELRVPSTTAKFSDDTLRAMLELQEQSQPAPRASAKYK